jgi:hypothetical protein
MKIANPKVIMLSAVAALIAVGALIGMGKSTLIGMGKSIFLPSTTPPCDDRYANSIAFRLERDGTVLTGADILSRVGNSSIGVIENVVVVRPKDKRIPAAMRINLRSRPASPDGSVESKAGMAFPWQPRPVQNEAAACLSYNVFLYDDLEFQGNGILPGLQGVDQSGQTRDRFVAHLAWRQDGLLGVTLAVTANNEPQTVNLDSRGFIFPRGQWIKIDQEVILNSPGQDNGILRVWIDGELAIEREDIGYRAKLEVGMSGVAANVSYGAADAIAWAPSDTKIWISPLQVSWH